MGEVVTMHEDKSGSSPCGYGRAIGIRSSSRSRRARSDGRYAGSRPEGLDGHFRITASTNGGTIVP